MHLKSELFVLISASAKASEFQTPYMSEKLTYKSSDLSIFGSQMLELQTFTVTAKRYKSINYCLCVRRLVLKINCYN